MFSVRCAALISLATALGACQAPPEAAPAPQDSPPVASKPQKVAPDKPAPEKPAPQKVERSKPQVQKVDPVVNAPAPKARPTLFNPAKPPVGYSRCQAGECHTADGRILTYTQVMEETGAKRMVGSVDTKKLPEAPADVAAPPEDAEKTASGLSSRVLVPGTGTVRPGRASTVQVHYSGWTTDGKAFDSTAARGRPAAFPLNRVIPGWQEAIQLMVPGEKRRVWIPESLAYRGQAGGPRGMLVFDIELLRIVSP